MVEHHVANVRVVSSNLIARYFNFKQWRPLLKNNPAELEKTEYQGNHISLTVTKQPGSVIAFDINVSPEGAAAAYNRALKTINKEISLPGFRKGKAPDSIVTSKYGKQIQEEWIQIVLKSAFNEALELTRLQPFNNNSVRCSEIKDLSKENGAKFTIEFEATPMVPSVDLNSLHLHKLNKIPVTEKDVDQVIRNIQLYNATWDEVKDRAIKDGDFVDLDIENLEEPHNVICTDTRFEVKKGVLAEWMYKILIGARTDESVEGVSEKEERKEDFDLDEEEEESEFRPTRCSLTIKSIKNPSLPELDDAFAQKVGATSFEDLREKVLADLNRRADEKMHTQMHRQLDAELLKHYHFDAPKSLVEAEIEHRSGLHEEWLNNQNKTGEEVEKEMEQLKKQLPDVVNNGLRLLFLLLNFAREQSLPVSQDEISNELFKQISQGMQMPNEIQANEVRSRLNQTILLRKARDYIIDHVAK